MYVVVVVEDMYRGQETAQRRSFCQIGYETPYIQKSTKKMCHLSSHIDLQREIEPCYVNYAFTTMQNNSCIGKITATSRLHVEKFHLKCRLNFVALIQAWCR
jgi:hypothetical protein